MNSLLKRGRDKKSLAKVLVVEDDLNLCKTYERVLKKHGYGVRAVGNGKQALEAAEEFRPQIIVLDLEMPVMSGLEFLQRFNALAKRPKVHIIIMSNQTDQDQIKETLGLGAYKYIMKGHGPPDKLAHIIGRLIEHNLVKKQGLRALFK